MDDKQFAELLARLDIVAEKLGKLVDISSEPEPLARKIVNSIATGVTILGIIGIIETLRYWLGG